MPQVLFVHSSAPASRIKATHPGSCTRSLSEALKKRIRTQGVRIVDRDVAAHPPELVDAEFVRAADTPDTDRTFEQTMKLKQSDVLVDEVLKSDVIVIGCPITDNAVPMPLKAWMDNIVRPGRTFVRAQIPGIKNTYGILHDKMIVLLEDVRNIDIAHKSVCGMTKTDLHSMLIKLGVRHFEHISIASDRQLDTPVADAPSFDLRIELLVEKLKTRWQEQRL